MRRSHVYLGVELSQEVKVFLEVGGQDGLDHQEAEALELPVLQVGEEVELWPRHEEVPGGRRVVVLQHRAVVIQNSLQGATLTQLVGHSLMVVSFLWWNFQFCNMLIWENLIYDICHTCEMWEKLLKFCHTCVLWEKQVQYGKSRCNSVTRVYYRKKHTGVDYVRRPPDEPQ